ncbi:MAG: hypothetical protein HKN43_11785 [Rhodothermales bacterium]|nr:hypothetical protein [Rhodothermales bacterium]
MSRVVMLLALVASTTVPALAQSRSEMNQGRQRGWDSDQTQRWIEYQASKRFESSASIDCPVDFTDRRDVIMNGNRITSQILNFGSISSPGNTITDIVWNGLGYGYEFGPFVAAEIVDEGKRDPKSVPKRDASGNVVLNSEGDTTWVMHVVSDGLTSNGGEISPDGSEYWGWQPIPCAEPVGNFEGIEVVSQESRLIPTSDAADSDLDGKPDSWPVSWYNDNLKEYVWPGALQQGASNADKEGMYFMNDYLNQEFDYYPFDSDSTKRGLGLEVETRLYQWANPLAEDGIFLVYKITNKSDKDLENVTFGMWGDPHIGGPGDWPDDLAFFDSERNMVFAWDADGLSDIPGRVPGYFGYKFLESPGVGNEIIGGQFFPGDGIDNDEDGYIDESWTDGIDNDGDWNADTDDVGIDGIAGTGDEGEGDGVPTAGDLFDITKPGEPNFEFTDIDESDQIGLTSFASPAFAGNRISNDERVWQFVQPGNFDDIPTEPGDYVFLYGSGNFALRAGETKRFSIVLLVGENFDDLVLNAETAQQIYDVGYRFAKPPDKPKVRAVSGDKKVTLYWDSRAERTLDPLSRSNDFEGYVIYRSTDHEFSDQQTITDINGSKFLFKPLTNTIGVKAKFDLRNGIIGPSPIAYSGRGVNYDLGDDTGLFHTYVDSNQVVNGQRYFYTVVAYDRGFAAGEDLGFANGIPPSETAKTITYNPTTDSYIFDVNTVSVTPGPVVAGYVPPDASMESISHLSGNATGDVYVKVVDPVQVPDGGLYSVSFKDDSGDITYDVVNDIPVTATLIASLGKTSSVGNANVLPASFRLRNSSGSLLTLGTDYNLNSGGGSVEILDGGAVQEGEELTAFYKYLPVVESPYVESEEANIVFNGLHLFVQDRELIIDEENTAWVAGEIGTPFVVDTATTGPSIRPLPYDYEIRFSDTPITTSVSSEIPLPFEVINLTKANSRIESFVPDINRNGVWDPGAGEFIIFLDDEDGTLTASWQVDFLDIGTPGSGDILLVSTEKPFATNDTYQISTTAAFADPVAEAEQLDQVYVVPNPYVVTNEFEPRNPVSRSQRGDRRLYFANVPQRCTIRIYTLAGELVETLEHDSALDDGKAFWDLRTKDNMNIAYGLYIFQVESDAGTSIGKFAIIK